MTFSCSKNSTCLNKIGSYTCQCPIGFGGQNCTDLDECSNESHRCEKALRLVCSNAIGSYDCNCDVGFTKVENTCADIDECRSAGHNCTNGCVNTYGSFYCKEPDFHQLHFKVCIDLC